MTVWLIVAVVFVVSVVQLGRAAKRRRDAHTIYSREARNGRL
jgi:hypothetical protein